MMFRQFSVGIFIIKLLLICFIFSQSSIANEQTSSPTSAKKSGKSYVSGSIVLNEFRSLSLPIVKSSAPGSVIQRKFPLTAQTYALAATYGTYITENFKTEIRYGTGIVDDTVDELLDINLHYYFNWYMGGTLPVTEYMSAYALLGVSFYEADITRREIYRIVPIPGEPLTERAKIQPSPTDLDDDLFGTKFSMSWMLGVDFQLNKDWYLAFEYGRLLKDTDSNIKVYQAGTQLRYEF